jgi:hypothetical protein
MIDSHNAIFTLPLVFIFPPRSKKAFAVPVKPEEVFFEADDYNCKFGGGAIN